MTIPSIVGRERGTALVMALVILVILTILGVTVMSTVTLEAKMAVNTQELNRAFHSVESALNQVYNDRAVFNLKLGQSSAKQEFTYDAGLMGSESRAEVVVSYVTRGNKPKRALNIDSIYSALDYDTANFEEEGDGFAGSNATTSVTQGVAQIVPESVFTE